MKEKAKGNMKATPYEVNNQDNEYSHKRSSKIKYISERTDNFSSNIIQSIRESSLSKYLYSWV